MAAFQEWAPGTDDFNGFTDPQGSGALQNWKATTNRWSGFDGDSSSEQTVPGAPIHQGASTYGLHSQAEITFDPPADDGGSPIIRYDVTSSPATTTQSLVSGGFFTGLTDGVSYTFTIVAVNAVGAGPGATTQSVVPGIPAKPTAVTAVRGNTQVTLTWSDGPDGGHAITSYNVTSTPATTTQHFSSGGAFTGLTNGVAYTFQVQAVNSIGDGELSDASNSVTPATTPSAPTAVAGTSGANASSVITWTDGSDGGSPVTSYDIVSIPATTTQHFSSGGTFTGLTNGTSYTFKVTANNAVGAGAQSSASASVTPYTTPSAPTAVTAVAGNTQATITWTDGATGGSAITSYNIVSIPATTTQHFSSGGAFTGLTNGVSYTFTVQAVNAAGAGATSSASNSVTPVNPFSPPTDNTFLSNTIAGGGADNRTTLANWLAATQNGSTALNAVNYLGSSNSSNTVTASATTGSRESTSGLISASGWVTFGGAFKTGAGNAKFVTLYSGDSNTDFVTFNLTNGTIDTQGGTATGTIHSIGQSFYWCTVIFNAAKGANATAKFSYANTAVNSQPSNGWTATTSDKLIAGPFACTT